MSETLIIGIVIVALLYTLLKDLVPASVAFLSALIFSRVVGVISTEEALSGFSSPVLFIIASFFVISRALQNSVQTTSLARLVLGSSNRLSVVMARLTIPVGLASGLIANTPIVASFIQPVEQWSVKAKISASKLLMPLSFAAILGGVLTLTGTSTNLVISGLLSESGQEGLGFFEITKLGMPVALSGILVLIFVVPKLLPSRKTSVENERARDSAVEYIVQEKIAGQTVKSASLRSLSGVYLATIIRQDGELIAPVSPSTVLKKDDTLQFVGEIKDVAALDQIDGLKPQVAKHTSKLKIKSASHYEVVLGHNSPVIHKTLKEAAFRGYYQAAVYAIHRSGQRLHGKLGDIELLVGDTLLLISDDYFEDRWSARRDFLVVSRLEPRENIDTQNVAKILAVILVVGIVGTVLALDLLTILLVAALMLVLMRVVSVSEARRAIDFDLMILIASSIGFAGAVVNSGLSTTIAEGLINSMGELGTAGLVASLIIGSVILTELITNTAAATLLFPIALAAANSLAVDSRILVLVVTVACSLSFLSPFGYQTNTMVYGPGGYRFSDYIRVGSVLTLTCSIVLFLTAMRLV